ncbi:AMP-binding protein [Thiocapsa sp. UBA6158]|jgi:long-chain acyl-CoA synthetase|uniref:AMP-binding protein n=1 Tax=Thiocapsa sp. UBA6158 TaxID=1947692 RepID=UPI0025D157D7|nr:AMP-binding protein [Thiocapsa sp. UBA6158]
MVSTRVSPDIPARFRAAAARFGESVGVCSDQGDWSYAALDRASDGVAGALAAAGIREGDRLGLLCGNGAEFVIAYLGALKAGGTLVPLNLLLNPKEMAYILADSGAVGLIHHEAFDAAAAAALDDRNDVAVRMRMGVTPSDDPAMLDFAAMMRSTEPAPVRVCDPQHATAAILYTSGTTGRPKGAMLSHANLMANADGVAQALALRPADRILVVLPMFHAFAATVGVLTPLLHGLGIVPVPKFDPGAICAAIGRHGASIFLGVPSLYGVLLRLDADMLAHWRSVRVCVSGGAAMPASLMAAFQERFGIPILEGDGPTECGPVTCVNPIAGVRKPGSIGLPIPTVETRILDPEGREVADGTYGEVCVRGPSVMQGYHNQPEATRESFFGDWFRTGDLGYRDADGYLYLVDRIKDLIITNGMNVYPRVIEEALYAHPEVAEAAVVGDPDVRHGEIPVAHVVLCGGSSATESSLRAWCRAHLGRHEVPRRLVIRDALPKNAAGKILKRELRRCGEHERGVDTA